MSNGDYFFSSQLGLANAALSPLGGASRLGLVHDVATARWKDDNEFRQFVRDVLPITQARALSDAKAVQEDTLHNRELQLALMHEKLGPFAFVPGKGDNNIELGLKGLGSALVKGAEFITGGPGGGDGNYAEYSAKGGLLTRDEWESLSDRTRSYLLTRLKSHTFLGGVAQAPGVSEVGDALMAAYKGSIAAVSQLRDLNAPLIEGGSIDKSQHPSDLKNFFNPNDWNQAYKEAAHQTLGNVVMDNILRPYVKQETLDRWKRDNSWYQLSSVGSEVFIGNYVDPLVIGGKGVGVASRFKKGVLPLREGSQVSRAIRQNLQREQITVRNPAARGIARVWANRISNNLNDVVEYAKISTPHEFARLPMFNNRYRALDGGASAHLLHWAVNNDAKASDLLNAPAVRAAAQQAADAGGFVLPQTMNMTDLVKGLYYGDPKAHAIVSKIRDVSPDELAQFAPGAQTLLDTVDALKTRATRYEQEALDLQREADAIEAGTSTSKALPAYHRWEIHTSLEDKQKQLADITDRLHKYEDYAHFLDAANTRHLDVRRVDGPSRKRFSQALADPKNEVEQHSRFLGGKFGAAHTISRMPKGLFHKRANTAELDIEAGVTSGLQSIRRQFAQFERYFGYTPEGGLDKYLTAYEKAPDAFARYKVMHQLEDEHLVQAVAHRFKLEPEVARKIMDTIHAERARTINGILTGRGIKYRSAPTLGERLTGKDQDIELVGMGEDGTATVNVLHGDHKQTYVVPQEALFARQAPEDLTQMPNAYIPMDTRALYYEMKHNADVLENLNASLLRKGTATLGDWGTNAGQVFNNLWKPFQLFRFGWPQRVLMDEGARAYAILGPMYWLTGEGAQSVLNVAANIPYYLGRGYDRIDKGKFGSMRGPAFQGGTATQRGIASTDVFQREAEAVAAPQIPESLWPEVNPNRLQRHLEQVNATSEAKALQARGDFWYGQNDPARELRTLSRRQMNRNRTNPALSEPINPQLTARLRQYGENQLDASREVDLPIHPLELPLSDWHSQVYSGRAVAHRMQDGPRVYDTVQGRRIGKGYVVPLETHPGVDLASRHWFSTDAGRKVQIIQKDGLADWYAANAELLSRKGMRVVLMPDGQLVIGRHFGSNEFKKAAAFAEFVDDAHPGTTRIFNLHAKREYVIGDPNELTPMQEAMYRAFAVEPVRERQAGKAPIEGEPEVFHGAGSRLPEQLLPRDQVPVYNGNMIGKGLYTTVDEAMAESYGATHIYTIRGSRSGKVYDTFDLDQPVRPLLDELEQYAVDNQARFNLYDPNDLRRLVDGGPSQWYNTRRASDSNEMTWANLYEETQAEYGVHAMLHAFLEEKHNAGALTHLGGTTRGEPHRVYVWLHPEDLEVRPLYMPNGEFQTLEQWFGHPQAVEAPVPESRIVYKGNRNPMIRRLRTVHNQLANLKNPKAAGPLVAEEQALMRGLGLEYADTARNASLAAREEDINDILSEFNFDIRATTHKPIRRDELSNPDTPRSRPVTDEDFQYLADLGETKLRQLQNTASTPRALIERPETFRNEAWNSTREPWGGATIDTHTGEVLATDADKYALTVRQPGQESVTVPINASREELDRAVEEATFRFADQYAAQDHYMGIFRDENTGLIEIDPVLVVDDLDTAEQIGAYTRATGGAYHFASGNGYWPPYVPRTPDEAIQPMALGDSVSAKQPSGALGEYRSILPPKYAVKDPGHFEKMLDEAHAENAARSYARTANGELRAREAEALSIGDMGDFDFNIDSPFSWLMNKLRQRHEFGGGYKVFRSSDGKTFVRPSAYAAHRGEMFRGLISSADTMDILSEGHGHGTSFFRRASEGYKIIQPPSFSEQALKPGTRAYKEAALYFQQYADMVNRHVGHSPVMSKMASGWTDDQIIHWLDSTPEGQSILRQVKSPGQPTGLFVADARGKLNYYLPSRALQRRVQKGRLSPSELRRAVPDERLPALYGPDLEVTSLDPGFKGMKQVAGKLADTLYNALGTAPIDRFSRQPFAMAMFNMRRKALIRELDSKWLDETTLKRIDDEAMAFAKNQVRRHLYNLTESTNFNDAIRFASPFWGAQYEAITRWLNIIAERPETIGKFFVGQRAVYNNFLVTDKDGNPVESPFRKGGLHNLGLYQPEDKVILPLDGWVAKKLKIDKTMAKVGIPIGSANTVLQGDLPLFPSLGPLVTIPADQFYRRTSATYGVEHADDLLSRWFFPVGRTRQKGLFYQIFDQLSPGWAKRVMQAQGPESDAARLTMEAQVGREMITRAHKLGKPEPSMDDIKKAADHMWAVRIVSSLLLPVQIQYLPKHQYWVDAYHRYLKQYGPDAWDKFVNDYGNEAAIYATSSSNSVGIPPTTKGMKEYQGVRDLVAKYPDWASMMVSPEAYMDDFSSDAYGQQFLLETGGGDNTTLRSVTSLRERLFTVPQEQLGWREYRKLSAAIEAELANRGLTNIQQADAQDLAQLKTAMVAKIKERYPAWGAAYDQRGNTIYTKIEELKKFVGDKRFDKRPDIQGVRKYLDIRQQVAAELDRHYMQDNGSRSLQAKENSALRDWFYNQVGDLILDNPAFAEFYTRYLDGDDLTLGGNGYN